MITLCALKRSFKYCIGAVLTMAALAIGAHPASGATPTADAEPRGQDLHMGNIRIHGYGDMHYNSPRGSDFPDRANSDQADAHRFVIGVDYHWTDDLWLEAEVDFEHAAKEMEFEFGSVNWKHSDALGLRGGVLLIPVGPLNEHHEPPLFYSVERPQIDNFIIPTSWAELGAGAFGHLNTSWPINYTAYVTSNLDPSGFSAGSGIRGGRGGVDQQKTTGAALVGRVDVSPVIGLTLGASGYHGVASTEKMPALSSIGVGLWELDAKWMRGPYELQGRYAQLNIGDAAAVTANNGANNDPVAERSIGWLVEGALHTGAWLFPDSDRDIVPFLRYQKIDTQDRVPAGFTRNLNDDRTITTTGLAFYPHPDVALKADVEFWKIGTGAKEERFNCGLAFVY